MAWFGTFDPWGLKARLRSNAVDRSDTVIKPTAGEAWTQLKEAFAAWDAVRGPNQSAHGLFVPIDRDAKLLAPMAWEALTETAREFWRDEARRRRSMIGE